ncbi:unnamed protein product [Symbiodinium necroappetens]|uniref:Uncharacterized protein n=1 Tax=Symbiodinium necroappetens TaxID=1628268 RepID=A0A812MC22_9DINO|nr:unnamed protein product [Symbiodinium necroappetens]
MILTLQVFGLKTSQVLRVMLQAAQKRSRVSCSPLLSVADLQKAFQASLQSVEHDLPGFLQSYAKSTFKTSATAVVPLWSQHETFWAGLLEVLPDAMLPTVKGRAALEACHSKQALASDKYLATTPLSVLVDRAMSTCRVQLSKFRELAVDGTYYASVSRRCTVEELAALNRLLAVTSRNLSDRSKQAATQQAAPTVERQALPELVLEPEEAEALPALQALVLFEPQAPQQSLHAPQQSSSSFSGSRKLQRFFSADELFGVVASPQETSKDSVVSRRDREALESALLVVPASASEKRLLKKHKKPVSKEAAKAAAPGKPAGKAKAKTASESKAKEKTGKKPSGVAKSKKGKAKSQTLKVKQEEQRLRKNFASRHYHEAKRSAIADGKSTERSYILARLAHRKALQEWDKSPSTAR